MTTRSCTTPVVPWQSWVKKNERLTPCNEPSTQVLPEEIGSHRIPIGNGYAIIRVSKRSCSNSASFEAALRSFMSEKRPYYGTIWKRKSPLVTCVSAEVTRQTTL